MLLALRVQDKHDGATDVGEAFEAGGAKVGNTLCLCRMKPPLPVAFQPCCLPSGIMFSQREIQMKHDWLDNLIGTEPPKTQTLRVWKRARAAEHLHSYLSGKWVRVWRGQGHSSTIGWLLITGWDVVRLGDMTNEDCCREGRPGMLPSQFLRQYLLTSKTTVDTRVYRLQFTFKACLSSNSGKGQGGVYKGTK